MKRRSLVALVALIVFVVLGTVVLSAVLFLTRTSAGREQLRAALGPFVARKWKGASVYIGHFGGNFLTELSIDSVEVRDRGGEILLASGRITLGYDLRDFVDSRVYIRRATVEHPYVHIVQHGNGSWNFKEIFASSDSGPRVPRELGRRAWGDYIVIDSTRLKGGTFLLTLPWHPDASLRGAARDSAIRVHVDDPARAVVPRPDGYGRVYAWRNVNGLLVHARLADPDSDRAFGKELRVRGLAADEFEPTFAFRNVDAVARILGDSVWFQVPHFTLPASSGTGQGKVWWGSHLHTRYDIAIHGDSVSLADVNWVYPTLPTTGGGSLDLHIANDPRDLEIVNYQLSRMDVRTTKSRLTGAMTFGTGARELLVRDVNLTASPVDFDLVRALAGGPFPMDWQGQITGTVRGPGGPLSRFVIDQARAVFRDAHVPGAVSRLSGRGELDILEPAFTAFHGFHVNVDSLDLRTIEFLNPAFPRLGGFVSGTATLDSSWLDVRFSDADITHSDGPGPPSRLTGSGRVTYDTLMAYDVALEAQPLSLTTLARSYPNPLRGLVSGPIRVRGTAPSLEVEATLQNQTAGLSFSGRLDADSAGGFGGRGHGDFSTADLSALLATDGRLAGPLGVHYDVDLAGIQTVEPAQIRGTAALDVGRTTLDGVRVAPARLRFHFADGQMLIDSARVRTDAATLTLAGGLALPRAPARDSIAFHIAVDSLGGLRPYISHPDTLLLGAARTPPDSLSGDAEVQGYLTGSMDALGVRGRLLGRNLYAAQDRSTALRVDFDLRDLLGEQSGSIDAHAAGVTYAGIEIDTVFGRLAVEDSIHRRFDVTVQTGNGAAASANGRWTSTDWSDSLGIEGFGLRVADADWRLAGPARLVIDTAGLRFDTLTLRNRDAAEVVFGADVPQTGLAHAMLRARRVPLRDLGLLMQLGDTITGLADVQATVSGTRDAPRVTAGAELSSVRWYGVDADRVTLGATSQNGRVDANLLVTRRGRPAITANASLPIAITLFDATVRNDSIRGQLRAPASDLALLNAFLPPDAKAKLSGQLAAEVTAGGTWAAPAFNGSVFIRDGSADVGALGVKFTNINASAVGVRAANGEDSVLVELAATGDGKDGGRMWLGGFAKNLFQPKRAQPFRFALYADGFHAFKKRTLADLYVSTPDSLRLVGSMAAPVLTGRIFVDRGSIFLADREIARKLAVADLPEEQKTAGSVSSAMLSRLRSNLKIPDLTVTLGDVRLRSAEADVKLVGDLRVGWTTARSTRTLASTGQLMPGPSLEGTLTTAGGTYQLDLTLVKREFQVLNDGTVTFEGPIDNPTLDIRARYNVRRPGDRDLGVIVSLRGPLVPYPGIGFSSDAGYEIPPSDLISYLVSGKPGFEFGQRSEAVLSVLAPTVSAVVADNLRQSFGSMIDVFRLQLGTASANSAGAPNSSSTWSQYLTGATIDVGQQFKSIFVSANVGFCQFAQNQGFNAFNALGAKAEYRIQPNLSMKLSYDPPTSSRVCNGQQGIAGFAQTPWQFGLSLAHTWRF